MEFRRHSVFVLTQRVEITALFANPIGVVMTFLPVVTRGVAKLPVRESIVDTRFRSIPGTLQMELADHPTAITGIRNQLCDHGRETGKRVVAVASIVQTRRIHAGHEAGTAGRADRTLAKGMRERHAFAHQLVNDGCLDVRITERADRVKTLLVRTVPENIGALGQASNSFVVFLAFATTR